MPFYDIRKYCDIDLNVSCDIQYQTLQMFLEIHIIKNTLKSVLN